MAELETLNKNLTQKKQVDEVEKSFKKMELDIRHNNELIMDINSDKERVKVDITVMLVTLMLVTQSWRRSVHHLSPTSM